MSMSRQHSKPMVMRMAGAIATFIGFGEDARQTAPFTSTDKQSPREVVVRPALQLVKTDMEDQPESNHKWRRHPQLRAYTPPLTPDAREARRYAVRGLYAAREGALEIATDLFTQAAMCKDTDLTAIPGFWELSRGQMQTAIDAYENAERYREAAALDAQIASIYRPNIVGFEPSPVTPQLRRRTAGGE